MALFRKADFQRNIDQPIVAVPKQFLRTLNARAEMPKVWRYPG
jgi:hypothetical protein